MQGRKMFCLTIAHNIFLTREERYKLADDEPTTIEVIGYNVPVWTNGSKSSEPAEEIFCKYYITNKKNPEAVKSSKNSYTIFLNSTTDRKALVDLKDKGRESLMMTYQKKTAPKGIAFFTVHFVSINDIEVLKKSIDI